MPITVMYGSPKTAQKKNHLSSPVWVFFISSDFWRYYRQQWHVIILIVHSFLEAIKEWSYDNYFYMFFLNDRVMRIIADN